jgi:ribosomal-protein-alanine N-acetyltransferase
MSAEESARGAAAVLIRRMVAADLDRVMEIARSLKQAPQWPRAAYLAALDAHSAPRRIALVAVDSATGFAEGFLVAGLLPPQAELESIAVAAGHQRQGMGGRLFAAMGKALKTEQVTEVILEVRASNDPALGFYRALGFAEGGRRPRYYADPVEDAVLMGMRL